MYRNKDILTKIKIMFDINFLRLTYIFQTPITRISIIHSLKLQLLAQVMTLNTDEKSFVHLFGYKIYIDHYIENNSINCNILGRLTIDICYKFIYSMFLLCYQCNTNYTKSNTILLCLI